MATIVEPEPMLNQEFETPNSSVLQIALAAIRITATKLTQTVDIASVFARKKIPLAEVANHYHKYDCWIIVYDRVYDITNFLREVNTFGCYQ
jgi:cytochrome b5